MVGWWARGKARAWLSRRSEWASAEGSVRASAPSRAPLLVEGPRKRRCSRDSSPGTSRIPGRTARVFADEHCACCVSQVVRRHRRTRASFHKLACGRLCAWREQARVNPYAGAAGRRALRLAVVRADARRVRAFVLASGRGGRASARARTKHEFWGAGPPQLPPTHDPACGDTGAPVGA